MLQTPKKTSTAAIAGALALVLISLLLSACGSSSSGSTSSTASAASTTTTSNAAAGKVSAALDCLRRNGVTVTPAELASGGLQLPKGVTHAQYEAAVKRCAQIATGEAVGRSVTGTAAFKAAVAKFIACMKASGANLPAPNTSGNGPLFNPAALNPASPQIQAGLRRCYPLLRAAYGVKSSADAG